MRSHLWLSVPKRVCYVLAYGGVVRGKTPVTTPAVAVEKDTPSTLTYLLTYMRAYLLTYLLTCLLAYLLTYLLTHLLTHSLTYLLTY